MASATPPCDPARERPVGLVLTGGGARSAYQVGVLLALSELLPRARNPFQVIVGTSAGAVAASVLAAEAHQWRRAVAGLERVWANFRSSQVFHVDTQPHAARRRALGAGARFPAAWCSRRRGRCSITARCASCWACTSIVSGIRRSIARGHLRAFALCATSYSTGHSVAFFDGIDSIREWSRVQRFGQRTDSHARSPDGECGDPSAVSAHQDRR